MKRILLLLMFASPVHAQDDLLAMLKANNAILMKQFDQSSAYPAWAEVRPQALDQRRSGVIFVDMEPRKIPGLVCACDKTFPGMTSGIIVAALTDTWFDRFDLPATATDDDILFVVQNRKLPAKYSRKDAWSDPQTAPVYQQPMYQMRMQPMMVPRMGRGRSGNC